MSLAGFHCKPDHIISADNFNKLQLVAANLCNDDYVDRADIFLKVHTRKHTHTLSHTHPHLILHTHMHFISYHVMSFLFYHNIPQSPFSRHDLTCLFCCYALFYRPKDTLSAAAPSWAIEEEEEEGRWESEEEEVGVWATEEGTDTPPASAVATMTDGAQGQGPQADRATALAMEGHRGATVTTHHYHPPRRITTTIPITWAVVGGTILAHRREEDKDQG